MCRFTSVYTLCILTFRHVSACWMYSCNGIELCVCSWAQDAFPSCAQLHVQLREAFRIAWVTLTSAGTLCCNWWEKNTVETVGKYWHSHVEMTFHLSLRHYLNGQKNLVCRSSQLIALCFFIGKIFFCVYITEGYVQKALFSEVPVHWNQSISCVSVCVCVCAVGWKVHPPSFWVRLFRLIFILLIYNSLTPAKTLNLSWP